MKNLKIAGVVVLYNPKKEDILNINSYLSYIDILYVMDNSSVTNENILPNDEKIKYIFNGENLGIAEPLNMAAKYAFDAGYEWLLTMDQDTFFPEGIVDIIISRIEKIDCSDVGIVTPWHKTKLKINKPTEKCDNPLDVMTSGNFVNLEIYKKIGGFKNYLFIDGVDIEYCLNLSRNNYRILRFNDLEIDHNLGEICYRRFFNKDLLITNHSAMRRYYQCRNYHYIRDEYIEDFKSFCHTLVKFKSIILGIILYEDDKLNKLIAFYRGYRDYKLGRKGRTYE